MIGEKHRGDLTDTNFLEGKCPQCSSRGEPEDYCEVGELETAANVRQVAYYCAYCHLGFVAHYKFDFVVEGYPFEDVD